MRAQQMRTLLDPVCATDQGKDLEVVKASLADSLASHLRPGPHRSVLEPWAEQLAKGGAVMVRPDPKIA